MQKAASVGLSCWQWEQINPAASDPAITPTCVFSIRDLRANRYPVSRPRTTESLTHWNVDGYSDGRMS
jgi:hypothetical protein